VELALVEAASPQIDPSAKALMARLERLEAALAGAPAPPPPPAAHVAPAPDGALERPTATPTPTAVQPAPAPAASDPEPAPEPTAVAVADPPAPAAPAPAPTLDGLAGLWPAVRDAVCSDNQLVGAALSDARPVELRDHELVVAFAPADSFNRRIADTAEHRGVVEKAVRGLTGTPLRVQYELRDLGPADDAAEQAPPSEDEIVARFVTEFDAEEIVPDPDPSKEGEA
jgi:DNA polymerase-3 subunit gamma/tau